MHNKPLGKRSLAAVRAAIEEAKRYAADNGVPLTAERLAAALDMDLTMFHSIVEGRYRETTGVDNRAKISAIQTAFCEATASVMEHAMQRGSSANMHMLYLKANAGYGEPEAETAQPAPVIIYGEAEISE